VYTQIAMIAYFTCSASIRIIYNWHT